MSEEYEPLVSLKQEVKRFCDTNQFNPMYVTQFYAQARCVITDYERTIADNTRLLSTLESCRAELGEVKSGREWLQGMFDSMVMARDNQKARAEQAEAREKAKDERIRELEGTLKEAPKWIDVRPKFAKSFIDTDYAREILALSDSTSSPSQPVKVAEEKPCQNCGQEKGRHEAGTFFCDNDTNGMMRYVPPAEKPQQEKL